MEEQILDVPGVGEVRCFRDHHGAEASASRFGAFFWHSEEGQWVPLHHFAPPLFLREVNQRAHAAYRELAQQAAA